LRSSKWARSGRVNRQAAGTVVSDRGGRLRDSLSFEVLVRLMLQRVTLLMNEYNGGDPPLQYQELGELNEFVPLLEFCGQLHISEQTGFGLGKIELLGSMVLWVIECVSSKDSSGLASRPR